VTTTQASSARELKPIARFTPTAPDTDFEGARQRMVAATVAASPAWTDHNLADPGTTVLEAAAFTLADMHFRVANAGFTSWPAAWPGWLDEAERHWSATLPAPGSGALRTLADAMRAVLTVAGHDAQREIAACQGRAEAESLLAQPPYAAAGGPQTRAAVVTALRWATVRTAALEHTDVIADAVAAADAATLDPAERDARAAAEIAASLALWPEECVALVRRERRRQLRELASHPLTISDPESLEREDGHTKIWPPHPVQMLTCEPVTDDDYASRARSHDMVTRAWTVRGRLPGIAWNGIPTLTPAEAAALPTSDPRRYLVADPDAEALTIVVETTDTSPTNASLRAILAHAVGTEAFNPLNTWRDSSGANDPRRLVCDEVGIAPLRVKLVRVHATLLIPPTANRAQVTAAATTAIDTFLASGQSADAPVAPTLSGPWPPSPQPLGGWVPGEAIRLSEVVAQVVAIPEVLAVRDLAIGREDKGDPDIPTPDTIVWASGANGVLAIPAGHVPRRSVYDCFTTEFLIDGGCDA
jgi:hypothetical protein